MLQIRSTVRLEDVESVLRTAAQRHDSSVLVVSHLGDALVFTLCYPQHYKSLLAADIRLAAFLPCRVAAWQDAEGVTLQTLAPTQYGELLGRADLAPVTAPLEKALRDLLDDSTRPLTMSAHSQYTAAEPSNWGATEDQVNMRMTVPQRTDCRGITVEDEAGTGKNEALGG